MHRDRKVLARGVPKKSRLDLIEQRLEVLEAMMQPSDLDAAWNERMDRDA